MPEVGLSRYETHTVDGISIHPGSERLVFPEAGMPEGQAPTTTTVRTWHEDEFGLPTFQPATIEATPPVVPTAEHGTGQPEPSKVWLDEQGFQVLEQNARGYVTATIWDHATASPTAVIRDADPDQLPPELAALAAELNPVPPDGGTHLVTDYINDDQGRTLRVIHPAIEIDPRTIGLPARSAQAGLPAAAEPLRARPVDYTLYLDHLHQQWTARGCVVGPEGSESWHIIGPVEITVSDPQGRQSDHLRVTPACACGPLGPDSLGPLGIAASPGGSRPVPLPERSLWTAWTRTLRDLWGRRHEQRVYHRIPASGDGARGTHYDRTATGYDPMNRPDRELSADDTIRRQVHDSRSQVIATWIGTDDTGATPDDPSGNGAEGNNMRPVELTVYDHGQDGGDGNATKETHPQSDDPADDIVFDFTYDFRNRRIETQADSGTHQFLWTTAHNNLDQVISSSRYHTSVAESNRTHHDTTDHDARQRVFQRSKFYVNSNGSLGAAKTAGSWFDPNSNLHKSTEQGRKAVTKVHFDSLDRPDTSFLVAESPSTAADNTNDVSADVVIEQNETQYNDADHAVATSQQQRFDDATGTGPLNGPHGDQPRSRDSFQADYPDPIGRTRFQLNAGTNGGLPWQRPALCPEPSDTALIRQLFYANDGGLHFSLDPMGVATIHQRDAAGREIELIEGATVCPHTGDPIVGSGARTTRFEHAPAGLHRLILVNPDTGDQVTTWERGTTLADSGIARNDLVVAKIYPTGDTERTTFNRQGQEASFTAPNGTIRSFLRNKLGQLTDDCVDALGTDVDGLIRRISTAYNNRNLVEFITSHDDPQPGMGGIVNQVQHLYNGIDCLTADRQSHDGPVDGSTPEVGYQCSGDEPLIQRRTAIILPDGRLIPYDYGAENSIDDVLNRVASIHDDATLEVLATFGYLGAAMPAITTLPTPALQRRWRKLPGTPDGDGGDPYTAYDRFSRTEQSLWVKDTGTGFEPRVHVQWGFDRNSLRTWRKDLLAPAPTQQDQAFLYDNLQQIVNRQRGVLNINHTSAGGVPAETEAWDHDEQGNWKRYDTTEDGQPAIEQTRGHNTSNQITKIDGSSANVAHDANGNMTLVPTSAPTGPQGNLEGPPLKTTWDAWDRTRLVHDQNDVLIQDNRYDGLTRRTQEITSAGTRHFFYNDQWRSVEERLDTATTPERQHIWHPTDRWDLIRRDRDITGNGTIDEHLWCLKDDLDPVAIADQTGTISERLAYSAFGITSFLDLNFQPRPGNESNFDWNFLFHGEFEDPVTRWTNYGYRFYAPVLGRWLGPDPVEEQGGLNLYRLASNRPITLKDIVGMAPAANGDGVPLTREWTDDGIEFSRTYQSFPNDDLGNIRQERFSIPDMNRQGGTEMRRMELFFRERPSDDCPPDCRRFAVKKAESTGVIAWVASHGDRVKRHELVHLQDNDENLVQWAKRANRDLVEAGCITDEKARCYAVAMRGLLARAYRLRARWMAATRHASDDPLMGYEDTFRPNPRDQGRTMINPRREAWRRSLQLAAAARDHIRRYEIAIQACDR